MTTNRTGIAATSACGKIAAVLLATAAAMGGVMLPSAAQAQGAASYDIPAGPLAQALSRYIEAGGVALVYEASLANGRASPGLKGSYSPAEALSRLLSGSGITFRQTGPRAFRLEQAPTLADGSVQLGPVRVEGAGSDGASGQGYVLTSDSRATEGTGSYTTRSMATATKLPLSIRETPQAVTVVSRQRLDDQLMTSVADVVQNTPGLFLSAVDGPGRQAFNARGFSIDNIMYDGIPMRYQGWVAGTLANMAIFDRAEVVRGATGLVTGSGNPSAAINLVRKRPTRDFQLKMEGSVGSWDNYRGQIDVSDGFGPDKALRLRFVGSYRDTGTFRDGEKNHMGIAHVIGEFDLAPDTLLMAGYSYQDDYYNMFWGGLPVGLDGKHIGLPRSTRPSTDWDAKPQISHTFFGELSHRFDNGWNVRLAGMATWQATLFSGSTLARRTDNTLAVNAYQADYDEDQAGVDLFASGPVTLFGREHDLTFGASHRQVDFRTLNFSGGGLQPGNIDIWTFGPASVAKPNFVPTTVTKNITRQDGIYGSARFNLSDWLKLIGGARVDWFDYDNVTGTGDYRVNANLTLYGGVIVDFDRHHSIYASFTDIFQPQSARGFAADIASQTILKPITGQNYEVGLKGEYMDGALNAAVALFQIDQKNRAFTPADQTGCPSFPAASCSDTTGLVRSKGVDAEIQGTILPDWQVSLGYTYTKVSFVRDSAARNVGRNFSPQSPHHIAKLNTSYRIDRLTIGGGLYWQSGIYAERSGFTNDQSAYLLANLMLGYRLGDKTDVQLNATNLFDKSYYKMIGGAGTPYDTYGEPRNIVMTVRTSF